MTKKRKVQSLEELLARPFCYYCERDFDDEKILFDHLKAKHFKCDNCPRRLNTAGGLTVHMKQVHKIDLTSIKNANPGREGILPEVFGMVGIPEDILAARQDQIRRAYFANENERRAATGNPPAGTTDNPSKRQKKIETPEEIRARLAEHMAAKRAARENGTAQSASPVPKIEERAEQPEPAHVDQPSHYHAVYSQPNSASPVPYGATNTHGGYPTFNNPQTVPPYPTMPPTYQPAPISISPVYQTTPPAISPASYVPYTPPSNAQPLPPGLPQRPNFQLPGLSRQQMSQMHPVQTVPPQAPQYTPQFNASTYSAPSAYSQGPPPPVVLGASPNGHTAQLQHHGQAQLAKNDFEPQDLDSMIKSERQQSENAMQTNGHVVHRTLPIAILPTQHNTTYNNVDSPGRTVSPRLVQSVGGASATESYKDEEVSSESASKHVVHNPTRNSTESKRAKKQFVLVYNNQHLSPEERRAASNKQGAEIRRAKAQLSQ